MGRSSTSLLGTGHGRRRAAVGVQRQQVRAAWLTRSAAQELGALGIRVNSVHPGAVDTPMSTAAEGRRPSAFAESFPIPRRSLPAEVTRLVLFLASDEAGYCTGSEYLVDGDMLPGNGY